MKLRFPHKVNDPRYSREYIDLPDEEFEVSRAREDERRFVPLPGHVPFASSAIGIVLLQWKEFHDRKKVDHAWRLSPREAMRLSVALHLYAVAVSGEKPFDLLGSMLDDLEALEPGTEHIGERTHLVDLKWILQQAKVR